MDAARRTEFLETMLLELGERGYAEIDLAAVLRRSQVSGSEFEAEFGGEVDSCLFAAYEELTGSLLASAHAAGEGDWAQKVCLGLSALLAELASRPAMATVLIRGFPAIRPAAYARYTAFLGAFVPCMREGRDYSGMGDELPEEVELLGVGAGESLIFAEIDAGRTERLPKMLPEILFSVLVPFIGPDRAVDEMKSATAAH